MQNEQRLHSVVLTIVVSLTTVIAASLIWFFFFLPSGELGKLGWYLFSFATGLTMIVMPCTLPLAFVIVPMVMGKGLGKGLRMALSFGAGVAIMLSFYGVIAAAFGKAGLQYLGGDVDKLKNWVYFFAGIMAYVFALGEVGLVKFRMPSYTGSAPDVIQKQRDELKAFMLGLFLGNIGVGCPHPATPLILIEIMSSGDIFYGWSMFFTHAIGRVVPLLLLALLAVGGVNGLSWLMARKDKIERATGWAMVFVAGFILTLGLFTHNWWTNSGQHNLLEKITQESAVNDILNTKLNTQVAHVHGLTTGTGIFGQPLEWGNWFIVFLWILPLWWNYLRERKRVYGTPALRIRELEHKMDKLEQERRGLEVVSHIEGSGQGTRIREIEGHLDIMERERRSQEEIAKFGPDSGLRDPQSQDYEEQILALRRSKYLITSIFLVTTFAIFLPFWFVNFESLKAHSHVATSPNAPAVAVKTKAALDVLTGRVPIPVAQATPAMTGENMPHTH